MAQGYSQVKEGMGRPSSPNFLNSALEISLVGLEADEKKGKYLDFNFDLCAFYIRFLLRKN